jgi:hypothetical protein
VSFWERERTVSFDLPKAHDVLSIIVETKHRDVRMLLKIGLAFVVLAVTGCSETSFGSPGEQCLASFRNSLKDPDSGKVVAFEQTSSVSGVLRYTATNSFGARIQGREDCILSSSKWTRNDAAEKFFEKKRRDEMDSASQKLKRDECLRLANKSGTEQSLCK